MSAATPTGVVPRGPVSRPGGREAASHCGFDSHLLIWVGAGTSRPWPRGLCCVCRPFVHLLWRNVCLAPLLIVNIGWFVFPSSFLGTSPLPDTCPADTFLRSRSSFYFSGGVLRNPKVLNLGDVRFISFSLVACASGVTAKKPLASPGVPAPFVEKTLLSPLDGLGSFARNQRFHSYVGVTPKATNERDRQTTSQTQTPA